MQATRHPHGVTARDILSSARPLKGARTPVRAVAALSRLAVNIVVWAHVLLVPRMAAADGPTPSPEITAVPTFECCGLYIRCDNPKATCSVVYRAVGAKDWQKAYRPVYAPRYDKLPKQWEKSPGWFMGDETFKGTLYDVYNQWTGSFRVSLVGLHEDTAYEVKVSVAGNHNDSKTLHTLFKTLSSVVPVERSIHIGELYRNRAGALVIEQSGTEQGWLRIVGDNDHIIDGRNEQEAALRIRNSRFLILENLTVRGGQRHGVLIENSEHCRLINCDISGFGRRGERNLAEYNRAWGKFIDPRDSKGAFIDHDAGICITRSGKLLIERCYVHDPRGTSPSWYYNHPAGPEAIYAPLCRGEVVLRYNDFIGSDEHRWNDTIGGWNNMSPFGSFHRDSDIYGNMVAFPNDDGIEMDGGNMNCRVFKNKFEGGVSGISTDPCVLGPSYIFRNLITNLGDENGKAINGIKTHGPGRLNAKGRVFYFNNTIPLNIACMRYFTGITRNNVWSSAKRFPIGNLKVSQYYDLDHDLIYGPDLNAVRQTMAEFNVEQHGVFARPLFVSPEAADFRLAAGSPGIDQAAELDGFGGTRQGKAPDMGAFEYGLDELMPYRPIPLWPDRFQINFEGVKGQCSKMETLSVKVTTHEPYRKRFTVKQNAAFSWLRVEPSSGEFRQGAAREFNVSINNDKIEKAKLHKAVFLIKLEDGYSLPISVYARIRDNSFSRTLEMEDCRNGAAEVAEAKSASGGKCVKLGEDSPATLAYQLSLPKDGYYYVSFRVKTPEGIRKKFCSFRLAIDGKEFLVVIKRCRNTWTWFPVKVFESMKLARGQHTLTVRPGKSLLIDAFKISSDPPSGAVGWY